ncbi:MAG: hypothetical protein C0442_10360 [Chlorobiaceae bacterium]|nr:hypothetical protein [Chlorobiaceae bacterium]
MTLYQYLPELEMEEMAYVQGLTKDFDENQLQQFAAIYRSKRKEPQTILFVCLLGFVGFAGIHRFLIDSIGLGIIYFFTLGFCFIGTIIDLINYKRLTFEYNINQAQQVFYLVRGGRV